MQEVQVGDTAAFLFPLVEKQYGRLSSKPFEPAEGSKLYIDIISAADPEVKVVDRGALMISGSYASYQPTAEQAAQEGEFTVQVYGTLSATESMPARRYASPIRRFRRSANVRALVFEDAP